MQSAQSQDLADNFPAGAFGFEHLKEESKEGAAHRINSFAAVGALVGLGEKSRRQERAKQQIQLREAVLLEVLELAAEVGEAAAPGRKEWGVGHVQYVYLSNA